MKPVSIPAAQRELAAFGEDQAAVVEQSVANGWQGLFALKARPKTSTSTAAPRRPPTDEEVAAAHKAAAEANRRELAKKVGAVFRDSP